MITKQRQLFYFVGDTPYKDLASAQKADLIKMLPPEFLLTLGITTEFKESAAERIADWMLDNADAIVDTLTTTPTSRLKARKSHGGTRKRKKLTPAAPAA